MSITTDIDDQDTNGREIRWHSLLLLVSVHREPVTFTLPDTTNSTTRLGRRSTRVPLDVKSLNYRGLPSVCGKSFAQPVGI